MKSSRVVIKKVRYVFMYFLAAIYILIALFSILSGIRFPTVFVAHAGVFAFLLTASAFFFTGYKISKKERKTKIMIVSLVFAISVLVIAVYSINYLIEYWRTLNSKALEPVVGLISDYSTFAALGVVFLTSAMSIRTQSSRKLK